jgi:hypothetical protein
MKQNGEQNPATHVVCRKHSYRFRPFLCSFLPGRFSTLQTALNTSQCGGSLYISEIVLIIYVRIYTYLFIY